MLISLTLLASTSCSLVWSQFDKLPEVIHEDAVTEDEDGSLEITFIKKIF